MLAKAKSFLKESPNWRTLLLTVIGVLYLLIGAGVFHLVEEEHEVVAKKKLFAREAELKAKYNVSVSDYKNLTRVILELEPYKSGVQWGFTGAIYFAITVVTTIGYGHSVPRTSAGKVLCIFYAILGIPLWLITFQAMGERINTGAKHMFKIVGHKLRFKFDEVSHIHLIPFGMVSCVLTILVGTITFAHFENWSYLNSAYFCVMTLATIGFGDFVALQDGESLQDWPHYVAFTLNYIMIGLAVIGAFLNLIILRMMVTLPETPDVSVNGGSKRGSSEIHDKISIASSSPFNDRDSMDDRIDPSSSRRIPLSPINFSSCTENDVCARKQICENLKNILLTHNRYFNSVADVEKKETVSKTYKPGETSPLHCECLLSNLCDECQANFSKYLELTERWLSLCLDSDLKCHDPLSCEDKEVFLESHLDPKASSYDSAKEKSRMYDLVKKADSDEAKTSGHSPLTIPEVKVSHIKISLPESQSDSEDHEMETRNVKRGAYSNYLSPDTCMLRRERYGSGDSGYLGGPHTSSCNLSQSVSEEEDSSEGNSRSTPDSRTDVEFSTRPVSFPFVYDQLTAPKQFQSQTLGISNQQCCRRKKFKSTGSVEASNRLFSKAKSVTEQLSSEFETNDSSSNDIKVTLITTLPNSTKNNKRTITADKHSMLESAYDVAGRCETLPVVAERGQNATGSERSSLEGIYKLVSSRNKSRSESSPPRQSNSVTTVPSISSRSSGHYTSPYERRESGIASNPRNKDKKLYIDNEHYNKDDYSSSSSDDDGKSYQKVSSNAKENLNSFFHKKGRIRSSSDPTPICSYCKRSYRPGQTFRSCRSEIPCCIVFWTHVMMTSLHHPLFSKSRDETHECGCTRKNKNINKSDKETIKPLPVITLSAPNPTPVEEKENPSRSLSNGTQSKYGLSSSSWKCNSTGESPSVYCSFATSSTSPTFQSLMTRREIGDVI